MSGILGNILENAIAANENVPEGKRFIQFSVSVQNGSMLFIVATNSFGGVRKKRGGEYLTTKHRGNGTGLSSIMDTAEKYGGRAYFSDRDEEFLSNVAIPLR